MRKACISGRESESKNLPGRLSHRLGGCAETGYERVEGIDMA
jgi:hypothetical protein